ncbi:MAG TPA: two-component regulator propeller domain-containing protein [Chitinophagaceae bacterium]|nr:two-component regulator propeller domain-containing protein [Chitinophagaceae bacterium]
MKKYFYQTQAFTFLTILIVGTACNGQVKKDSPKEKVSESNKISDSHPKLIKTIGNPGYGNVQCGLQDKAGNLWFGTTENGLYKYDGKSFTQYLVADGLNSNSVYTLFEDKGGKFWIGTDVGLCLYDGKTFAEIKIPLTKELPHNKNDHYRNKHWVFSIIQAKSGKLWFATIDGVYIYDGKSFTPFIINETASGFLSTNHNVERILEDKAGNIWFGARTDKGVYRYDGKSVTKLELMELFQDGPKPKPHSWGWPQLQDKNGNIWFTNWGGAYRYDPSASLRTGSKSFTSFKFPNNGFTRIIEDKKGNLWFGGDGIHRYDGKTFTHFSTKDGLINPWVWSILDDKTGKLWVGTRATGLYLFDGKRFINYSEYKH